MITSGGSTSPPTPNSTFLCDELTPTVKGDTTLFLIHSSTSCLLYGSLALFWSSLAFRISWGRPDHAGIGERWGRTALKVHAMHWKTTLINPFSNRDFKSTLNRWTRGWVVLFSQLLRFTSLSTVGSLLFGITTHFWLCYITLRKYLEEIIPFKDLNFHCCYGKWTCLCYVR